MAYFLRHEYIQKPRQWGPASSVRSAISNWFDRLGVDPASVNGAIGWDGWLHYIRPENHIIPTNHVWSDTLQAFDIPKAAKIAIHTSSIELRLVFCKFNLTTEAVSASSYNHGIVQVADATNVDDANTFLAAGSVTSYLTDETITVYGGTLNTRTGITSAIGIGSHTLSARYDGSTKYQLSLDRQVHANIDGSQGAADLKTGPLYFNGRVFSSNPRFCPEIVLVISSQCDAAVAMRLHDDPYGMIQPRAMPIYSFASATAGATIQATVEDGLSIGETLTRSATLQGNAVDGLATGESLVKQASMIAASIDASVLSDISSRIASLSGAVSDGMVLSDTSLADVGMLLSASDGFSISDSTGSTANLRTIAVDGITLGDAITVAAILSALSADGLSLSDSIIGDIAGALSGIVSDGIRMSDTSQRRADFLSSISTTFNLSELQQAALSATATAIDGMLLSDLASILSGLISGIVEDGFAISDSGEIRANFTVTVSDSATMAEAISAIMTLTAIVTDTFNLGDAAIHILAQGVVSVSFSVKKSTITFTVKKPNVTFTVH